MKFLCSFGGKILPRPSDSALRYVGGHTRIISVPREISFLELKRKLSDVFGGTCVFKYQLPDEDLDALVTVSSDEDMENMMEEYDKLAEISPDGSAKLRVFLFSPFENDFQMKIIEPESSDNDNRFVDAVNGVVDTGLSDLSSARASNEILDCYFGGVSSSISSPDVSQKGIGELTSLQDPFEPVYPPILPSDPLGANDESKKTADEQSFISVSLDYLESLQSGYKGNVDLEQRDRIQYLNSRITGAPIYTQETELGSDQFFDVFASQKAEEINQSRLSVDPEAQYSYFDDIIRQHQPPVGPPQFLLKQDLLGGDPLGVTSLSGQHSEVNPLLTVVKPDTSSQTNTTEHVLGSKFVDHGNVVDSAPKISHIQVSQFRDQFQVGQSTEIQWSSINDLITTKPLKDNILKPAHQTSYHDDQTYHETSAEHLLSNEQEEKSVHTEKSKPGPGVLEDHGVRLQIIKNSDLEELRELGTGAFGTVYHGKWRGTDVAIKRINDRCFAGKPSEQERSRADFWNEACKLADLHHPNVVTFYGVVTDGPGGSMATVTEFMINGSLWQAMRENDKSLDQRKRRLIAMDVAFGMEYLHGKNIVHFDLKSDNLLVNLGDPNRPICKVGDLGLSKVKRQTLISGGVRGTLPWMAPELLNGRSTLVSEKVDVFSFGIVMWELLTSEEPYADLHHGAIIGGIVNDTLRPTIPESCDEEWRALMVACWSTDPSDRPSFTEIAGKLRAMTQQSHSSFTVVA